jgi:Sugar (and other) transporter
MGDSDADRYQFTLLFTAIYSFTVGPAAYSLAAESFPSSVREAGMAVCVFINMTSLGVLLLIYPIITAPINYTASLCIFVSLFDPSLTC